MCVCGPWPIFMINRIFVGQPLTLGDAIHFPRLAYYRGLWSCKRLTSCPPPSRGGSGICGSHDHVNGEPMTILIRIIISMLSMITGMNKTWV